MQCICTICFVLANHTQLEMIGNDVLPGGLDGVFSLRVSKGEFLGQNIFKYMPIQAWISFKLTK